MGRSLELNVVKHVMEKRKKNFECYRHKSTGEALGKKSINFGFGINDFEPTKFVRESKGFSPFIELKLLGDSTIHMVLIRANQ